MQNNPKDFMKYFDEAMQIHVICANEKLPVEYARVLTYIHVKSIEENSLEIFNENHKYEIDALEIMLGIKTLDLKEYGLEEKCIEKIEETADIFVNISSKIKQIDKNISDSHGMENRLRGELQQRLQLYKDKEFREKILNLYKNKILPQIGKFTKKEICQVFKKIREKQDKEDEEFLKLFEDIK